MQRSGERVRALDGLRGLALAAVLAYHAAPAWFRGGYLGVEVFFVLSGFLIASLLLDEEQRTGRLSWGAYAARRLRRVGPALLAFLVALVVLGPILAGSDSFRLRGDVVWTATGLTNWHLIRDGASYFGQLGRPPLVRHLWSLAIELQFYVLCPALVMLVAKRRARTATALLGGGVVLSAVAMAVLYRAPDPSRAYYGTDARIGALLTGALLAVLVTKVRLDLRVRVGRYSAGLGVAGLGVLGAMFLFAGERSRFMYPAGFLLCRLATAAVVLAAFDRGRLATLLGRRLPRWLGSRSYSIYLWHWPLLALLRPRIDVGWSPAVAITVALAGALVLGELSYRFVEQPVLHRQRPVFRRRRLPTGVRWTWAAGAGVVLCLLLANLPTTDPIVASLKAGERAIASEHYVPPTATSAPAATTEEALTATAAGGVPDTELASQPVSHAAPAPPPTTPPAPPVPPPASIAVTAIGDSVMLGAAGPLQARLGPPGLIDAKVSRQFAEGVVTARDLRDQGRLGQVAVVHLGTNGPPRTRDVDALMGYLASVPRVLLVTVRMPRTWEGETNDALRGAAARYPSVVIVDWFAYSDGHRDWFASDGVHLKPIGAQAYADFVAAAVPPPPPPPPAPPKPAPSPYTRRWRWSSWASFYGGRSPR